MASRVEIDTEVPERVVSAKVASRRSAGARGQTRKPLNSISKSRLIPWQVVIRCPFIRKHTHIDTRIDERRDLSLYEGLAEHRKLPRVVEHSQWSLPRSALPDAHGRKRPPSKNSRRHFISAALERLDDPPSGSLANRSHGDGQAPWLQALDNVPRQRSLSLIHPGPKVGRGASLEESLKRAATCATAAYFLDVSLPRKPQPPPRPYEIEILLQQTDLETTQKPQGEVIVRIDPRVLGERAQRFENFATVASHAVEHRLVGK